MVAYKRRPQPRAITARSLATCGQVASIRLAACCVLAATCTRITGRRGNASSEPACCNCQMADGESAHPGDYRGCTHAKERLRMKKSRATRKSTGRMFSSAFTTPASVVLRRSAKERKIAHLNTQGGSERSVELPVDSNQTPAGNRSVRSGSQCKQCASGQHVQNRFCRTADRTQQDCVGRLKYCPLQKLYSI